MPSRLLVGAILALCSLWAPLAWAQDQLPVVRIVGTFSTGPYLQALARTFKQGKKIDVETSADYASLEPVENQPDAFDAMGQGKADIALITRPLTLTDRSAYPDLDFKSTPIGMEVVAIAVSNDLWAAGVHSIDKETMRAIYERKITNWRAAPNGPDTEVEIATLKEGHGVWETFADWLYGDNMKAPLLPKADQYDSNSDLRDALEFGSGAIAPIAAIFADGSRCHALGLRIAGHVINPTAREVAAGAYPIVRPIIAVVGRVPSLETRAVLEYMTSPAGQDLLRQTGDFGLEAAPKGPPGT
jgi:phosphate transport system substrate-binding protein